MSLSGPYSPINPRQRAGAGGAQLLDAVARPGTHGTRIGFVHPKSLCGVLTEFVEPDGKTFA